MSETRRQALPVSEIRDLLRRIEGIQSVEVRTDPAGTVESIDIAVDSMVPERRVIRDVESALMSGLGLRIDHRAISIGRTPNGVENGGADSARDGVNRDVPSAAKSLPAQFMREIPEPDRRVRLQRVICEPDGEYYCEVTIELCVGDRRVENTVREADTGRGRLLAAGRAAVNAVSEVLDEEAAIALEGIEDFSICEATGLLALLRVRRGRTRQDYYGTALVEGDQLEAAARAVLDALNRFLEVRDRENTSWKGHG